MSSVIGRAGRDGDGIAIRLEAGPRRGCYRVMAEEAPALLAGDAPATLQAGGAPVGDIAAPRSLRVLRGGFRDGLGFIGSGVTRGIGTAAFLIPRAHLAAHYDRHDGPVPVLSGGR